MTPDTAEDLLYDDVLWVQQARRDHFDFVAKMEDRGVEVLDLDELPRRRRRLRRPRLAAGPQRSPRAGRGRIAKEVRPWLDEMAAKELAHCSSAASCSMRCPGRSRDRSRPVRRDQHTGFVIAAAAQHPVHARQLVMDLQRCHAEPDVLAGPPPETLLTTAVYKFHPAFAGADLQVWLVTPTANRATTGR